jgi:hypothetical protein
MGVEIWSIITHESCVCGDSESAWEVLVRLGDWAIARASEGFENVQSGLACVGVDIDSSGISSER